jgi:hypothetical protein
VKDDDSPDNWIQVRLFYNAFENEKIRKLDQRVLEVGSDLESEELVESWHIRFSGPYISLRVKTKPRNRAEVENRIEALKDKLTNEDLIRDSKIDMKEFLQSNEVPSDLESWKEWNILIEILNLLSRIARMVNKLEKHERRLYMTHNKVIHHFYNMTHIQDTFIPFLMKYPYDSIIGFLEEGEGEKLTRIVKDLGAEEKQWYMKLHYGQMI